ncbi:MAG: hypothetical protein OJF49_004413 [Ktedonobacterales bacterium]|jgi:hypothetical protein|nr:MAG: hypothetical protein OJF49_004413 [Ktedonobacterales bacterium]
MVCARRALLSLISAPIAPLWAMAMAWRSYPENNATYDGCECVHIAGLENPQAVLAT